MVRIGGDRVPMREQPPTRRVENFHSVPYGYDEKEVITEAQRCMMCKYAPCEYDCPVHIRIKGMILAIAEGDFYLAYSIAKKDNPIPAIAGRVCPQEDQCEGACPLYQTGNGINIGKLEAYVADWAMENGLTEDLEIKERKERVAVIGSGPASISCAADLRRSGYQVVMYEALHEPGGVLLYGIPAFRLPHSIVEYELSQLSDIGVDIRLNSIVGQNIDFKQLQTDFDAIFIGTGAGAPIFLRIPGEELNGVYSANEFLIRANLMKAFDFPRFDTPIFCGERVGVIGAGNVAMDSARCALRLGAKEVHILYRRTKRESPARDEELHHALEEGIVFQELVGPKRIIGSEDGWVTGIELIRMRLTEEDKSGRPRPVPIPRSEFVVELDTVVEALGSMPNRLFLDRAPELTRNKWGILEVDKDLKTSIKGVYAGGDAISGGATVIQALGEGRTAASSIDEYLNKRRKK
jgi:glutamate synthase (NADPH/NADH) small chain